MLLRQQFVVQLGITEVQWNQCLLVFRAILRTRPLNRLHGFAAKKRFAGAIHWRRPGETNYGSVPEMNVFPPLGPRPARTRNTTSCPLLSWDVAFRKSSSLFTGCLLTFRMIMPACSWISSPTESGFTSVTCTPL